MPILIAPVGERLTVSHIGGEDKTRKHLESLGITESCPIEVISNTGSSVILLVKESRLALDKDVANSIYVD